MSKVLFVNGNLYGHINPTLPVVAELVKRGEEVWYYCSKLFRENVEAVGAKFIDWGENLDSFMSSYQSTGNHPFYMLLEYMIRYDNAVLPELLEMIDNDNFTTIIYDSILGAGYFLKQILKIPVICSNSSFVMSKLPVPDRMMEPGFHPQLDYFYELLKAECDKWKVKVPSGYEFFINKGDLNIVYTSKEFNSDEEFDTTYQFVGPSIKPRDENLDFPYEALGNERIVYISLGTINTDFVGFYQMCMNALSNINYIIVMSVGRKCDINSLGDIPSNFIICHFAPQLELLKRADVFISHGGFNSVSEALSYGVPVITIPMVNDQYMVAKRLEKVGAGISLRMNEITTDSIKESVLLMLSDKKYQKASERIGRTLQLAGGYEKAADHILELLKE